MAEMHKCRDCDRQIPVDYPCCIFCKSKYRKKGICWWCGERPVKPPSRNGQQSQYCEACQIEQKGIAKTFTVTHERTLSTKGTDQRGRSAMAPQVSSHMLDDKDRE